MSDRELERRANHKLAVLRHVEEVSGNVAATCRYYGISRQACYGWKRRYEAEGFEGLKDRSCAPHHQPTKTVPDVVEKILLAAAAVSLRAAEDLDVLGPVPRHHHQRVRGVADPAQARPGPAAGLATVQADPDSVEAIREATPRPPAPSGREVHRAVGQKGKKKRYYQYTAIDDCTRIRVLRAYERNDQKTAIQFIDHVLAKLPFQIERVQTDNGAEFGQAFHWHLLDKGIDHVKIRPRTPRLNGKVCED